jgi:predicted RNA binding protein YcfA (HicA-like mRNA interferase family)
MGLSELPDASGKKHQKAFQKLGWVTRRAGNHIVMTHPNSFGVTLSIPNHDHVKRPLLQRLIRLAGLTDSVYRKIFDSI